MAENSPASAASQEGEIARRYIQFPLVDTALDRLFVEPSLSTLRKGGLNPTESAIVDDAKVNKYVPALRNAMLMALVATPGMFVNSAQVDQNFFNAIMALVGISWFAITMKSVKAKYVDFGTELTKDMLEPFLTSTFILLLSFLAKMGQSGLISALPEEARELGKKGFEMVQTQPGLGIATAVTMAVVVKMIYSLVKSVIKYDANDAMLTGSDDAARQFFEDALSGLRNAAFVLKSPHDVQAANFSIAKAIEEYFVSLRNFGIPVSENMIETGSSLLENVTKGIKVFDTEAIPLLKRLFSPYCKLIDEEDDAVLKGKYSFTVRSLDKLLELYAGEEEPQQGLADITIANALENLALFFEVFRDKLTIDATDTGEVLFEEEEQCE